MPITTCSHCGETVDAHRYDSTETMFDWQCPACGEPISIDGNAREQLRQRESRRELTEGIIAFADELQTDGVEPPPLSVEQLQTRLEDILADVNKELDRRNSP
ncbi:hypothetical protein [Haloplanus halophilus]|uniref:hypothetical protein n=1 Tax=Haloplanus halophilus TaxID=2949993 RepID=UPI00203BA17E|nr:hypothetical protein [Haloplanus sp. GDY1]